MVWYADGSIEVAANGQVATGTGTAFLKNVRIGDGLTIAGSASMHEVTNIASDTQLTFSPPFAGAAGAGKQYRIAPIQGYVKEAADRLREVLREVGPLIMSEALQALAGAQNDQERRAAVGLGKVDNTADADKPISKAMADALASPEQKNPELVGQAEAEAGTGTTIRGWPVVRVWQSAAAWFGQSGYKKRLDESLPALVGTAGGINKAFLNLPGVTDAQLAAISGYAGALEIREVNQVVQAKAGNVDYAPGITFHYGGYAVNKLWMNTDAGLYWGGQKLLVASDVQRGSNGNGDFVKFPDGTMICTGVVRMPAQAISTDNLVTLNFPAAFVSPAYNLQLTPKTVIGSGSQDAIGNMLYNGIYTGSYGTSSMTVASYAYRSAVSNPVDFYFTVTGRWK